jgi:hypothetical protein
MHARICCHLKPNLFSLGQSVFVADDDDDDDEVKTKL